MGLLFCKDRDSTEICWVAPSRWNFQVWKANIWFGEATGEDGWVDGSPSWWSWKGKQGGVGPLTVWLQQVRAQKSLSIFPSQGFKALAFLTFEHNLFGRFTPQKFALICLDGQFKSVLINFHNTRPYGQSGAFQKRLSSPFQPHWEVFSSPIQVWSWRMVESWFFPFCLCPVLNLLASLCQAITARL